MPQLQSRVISPPTAQPTSAPTISMAAAFIKKDPWTTDDSKGTVSLVAPQVRLKKKTLRTKTGCVTCRARRIKCDESRPVCKRCNVSRHECRYALPPPASTIGPLSSRSGANDCTRKQWTQKQEFAVEIEPFDWEFQETVRYFLEVVVPSLPPEGRHAKPSDFQDKNFPRKMLYANVIGDQIERASKARGRVIRPGEDPAFAASWAGYHRSVIANIHSVNQFLRDDAKYTDQAPATLAILQLLISDLKAALLLWEAHLRGFLAYVKHRGGAAKIMSLPKPEKSRLSPVLAFTMQINTTCPANQQIEGSDDFTDEEIKTLIAFDPFMVEPCPVDFHLARVRITRLRVTLAHFRMLQDHASVTLKVHEIFNSIWLFDLDSWIKETFGDKGDKVQHQARIMGRIYAVAIRLYGILTLPQSAIAAWAVSSQDIKSAYPAVPGCGIYETLRRRHRDELLRMVRQQWEQVRLKKWLAWPLLVVGVAIADDTIESERFVDASLLAIWKVPDVSNSSITALEKLRVFWRSGKTGWEDCFDEPIPSAV